MNTAGLMRRKLGSSDLEVSPVSLGCWPFAGISSIGVSDSSSCATIEAALECGINHFDTAYSYGYDGRSDRVLRQVLENRWEEVVLGTKVGMHYDSNQQRVLDCSKKRILFEVDEIRKRLGIDRIDLLYLHSLDGKTAILDVAETFAKLVDDNIVRYVGLSNTSLEDCRQFAEVLRPVVIQPPFNMLQQETLSSLSPFIQESGCGAATYWPLMKGLLAGKLERHHVFDPSDRRLTYPIYQGREWELNQDFLDELRAISHRLGWSVTRLVVRWTAEQNHITTVLCGAKYPEQIRESAEAMIGELPSEILLEIDRAIERREQAT